MVVVGAKHVRLNNGNEDEGGTKQNSAYQIMAKKEEEMSCRIISYLYLEYKGGL